MPEKHATMRIKCQLPYAPARLSPEEGAGLIIALYLDIAQQVDFYVGTVGMQDVYAALDRSTVDDIGQANVWMQQADGLIREVAHDWELTPLTEEDGAMAKVDAVRVFHDAPDLFAAVWQAWVERRQWEDKEP